MLFFFLLSLSLSLSLLLLLLLLLLLMLFFNDLDMVANWKFIATNEGGASESLASLPWRNSGRSWWPVFACKSRACECHS